MRYIITALILLLSIFSFAQNEETVKELYKRISYRYDGKIEGNNHQFYPKLSAGVSYGINAVGDLENLVEKPRYLSGELRAGYQTTGRNIYAQMWRFPEWKAGFYGVHLYNDTVFGQPNGLFLSIDVPFNKYDAKRKWNYSYSIAGGLSFNFRPNNPQENPYNTLIGSYNNVFIELGFWANYKINTSFDAKMGLTFVHFSNGASTLPNMGMNMLGPKLILQHHLTQERPNMRYQKIPDWRKRHGLTIYQAFGSTQVEEQGKSYLSTTTSLAYKYWWIYKGRWIGQVDLFYDESYNSGEGERDIVPIDDRDNPANFYSVGFFAGYEAIYNRWSFVSGWGVYLWRRYEFTSPHYQRFGVRYRLWEGLAVGVGLKARTFAADYIEWSISYNIF